MGCVLFFHLLLLLFILDSTCPSLVALVTSPDIAPGVAGQLQSHTEMPFIQLLIHSFAHSLKLTQNVSNIHGVLTVFLALHWALEPHLSP